MPTLSVIIPSKNRPASLRDVSKSLAAQSKLPDQVIIVDQTPEPRGVENELRGILPAAVRLDYVWDPRISGVTMARNVAIDRARGDILLFLDDDVTLYPAFIERLLRAYEELPEATGISGIPDNYSPPGKFFHYWSKIFMRPPIHDDRQPVYWNLASLSAPVRVTRMSGGMMSVKKASIKDVRFDANLKGGCDGEDVDFCMQLKGVYFIHPGCRLTHHFSAEGREVSHWTQRHARGNTYLYLRNWRESRLAYAWLNAGWFFAAALGCVRRGSLAPLREMLAGRREGRACALPGRTAAIPQFEVLSTIAGEPLAETAESAATELDQP